MAASPEQPFTTDELRALRTVLTGTMSPDAAICYHSTMDDTLGPNLQLFLVLSR